MEEKEYQKACDKYTEGIDIYPTAILYGGNCANGVTRSEPFVLLSENGMLRYGHSRCR